jgi:hypothetical protein
VVACYFSQVIIAWAAFAILVSIFLSSFSSAKAEELSDEDKEKVRLARLNNLAGVGRPVSQQATTARPRSLLLPSLVRFVVVGVVGIVLGWNSFLVKSASPQSPAPATTAAPAPFVASWPVIKSNWLQLITNHAANMKVSSEFDEHDQVSFAWNVEVLFNVFLFFGNRESRRSSKILPHLIVVPSLRT